jgi:hypothetical protein
LAYGNYESLVESGIDFAKLLPQNDVHDESTRERKISTNSVANEDIVKLQKQV